MTASQRAAVALESLPHFEEEAEKRRRILISESRTSETVELIPPSDGIKSRDQAGEALIEIRDSRLYRIEAGTFEEYCQSKFKMTDRHARRLMQGAGIAKKIGPVGPVTEYAIREIAKVAPEKRQEVFQKATESASGHVPTARKK